MCVVDIIGSFMVALTALFVLYKNMCRLGIFVLDVMYRVESVKFSTVCEFHLLLYSLK